jgi:sodium-coupled monocarboxylate transporter 8/12
MIQGLAIFAYFSNKGCDPLASGQVKNLNQIIPFTMLELFHDYPGLPGLFIAALAAASLSTISSGLSSLSAVTYEDFIKVFFKNVSDEKGTNISKAVVAIYGLISVGFAFLLSNVEGPLGQIMAGFMGAITGPEAGLFLISVFYRKARPKAVIVGTFTGMCFVLWIILGQNFSATVPKAPYLPLGPTDQCSASDTTNSSLITYRTTPTPMNMSTIISNLSTLQDHVSSSTDTSRTGLQTFYSISYMYFNLIGCILVISISTIISLFTQPKTPEPVSEKTVLPLSIFLPSCLKRRCSVNTSDCDDSTDSYEREGMMQMESCNRHKDRFV